MTKQDTCRNCGSPISTEDFHCPGCGAEMFTFKSRAFAAFLAFFFGIFGVHRFYLRQFKGLLYLLFFWTGIPMVVGFIEGIVFLCTDQQRWNNKYNRGATTPPEKGVYLAGLLAVIPGSLLFLIGNELANPSFERYAVRTRVSEGILAGSSVRPAVEAFMLAEQRWPATTMEAGLESTPTSGIVESVTVTDGMILVRMAPASGTTGTIIFTPSYNGSVFNWNCGAADIDEDLLPTMCR